MLLLAARVYDLTLADVGVNLAKQDSAIVTSWREP